MENENDASPVCGPGRGDPTMMYRKYEHKQTTSSGRVEVASRGGLSETGGNDLARVEGHSGLCTRDRAGRGNEA